MFSGFQTADSFVILYIEDSDDDAFFFQRALKLIGFSGIYRRLSNGLEAQQYLAGQGRFADRSTFPSPDILVSDLKMPGMTGVDLCHWIRSQFQFKDLPVIVFTTSALPEDLQASLRAGACDCLEKPGAPAQWQERIQEIFSRFHKAPMTIH